MLLKVVLGNTILSPHLVVVEGRRAASYSTVTTSTPRVIAIDAITAIIIIMVDTLQKDVRDGFPMAQTTQCGSCGAIDFDD